MLSTNQETASLRAATKNNQAEDGVTVSISNQVFNENGAGGDSEDLKSRNNSILGGAAGGPFKDQLNNSTMKQKKKDNNIRSITVPNSSITSSI